MATVPPGPSSALSPAESAPFPRAGSAEEPAGGRGGGGGEHHRVQEQVSDVINSGNKKQKSMLVRGSQAAMHIKMQAREQQQMNGVVNPGEDADRRPDDQRDTVGSCEEAPAARQHSEHSQHEGHSTPFCKNGSHSPLGGSSMNGEEFDPADPADLQPPDAEMARLDLSGSPDGHGIRYVRYESELQMPWIMRLITKDLSEPYSIYTYRYFIHNWPQLCFLAMVEQECVGAIVCKLDMHKKMFRRGYIAMLAVDSKHRRKSIGTNLVKKAIYAMVEGDCDEVVLETEITNKSALKLYENLGFVRDKRLFRYYLNGVDALRLKLWLR
ncbi:N-alpha-acetyltransferase 30 [Anoplopoma fimbria]|uniref:N-alpha-acetyltransferase 30 n=1 Tax=Anoplopoma fimbria TaxID=229290 RepID=UPI0023ED857F|nr:N-alpha-acetyltransferase 30 [Anoplopoma fimbria]